MATYAAYRHVELDNVGYGKKRVLKPPGGGSSDIFGASETGGSPRRTKTHMTQSSLGAALFDADVPDSKMMSNGNGSTPESPRGQANGGSTTSINSNGSSGSSSHASNKPGGNPVTGAGYGDSPQQNGDSGSEKSSTDSSPGLAAVNRMRNRVPPGGYSSGLW